MKSDAELIKNIKRRVEKGTRKKEQAVLLSGIIYVCLFLFTVFLILK